MNDMNAAPGPGHPFDNIPPDDADHLLFMVIESHKPFSTHPVSLGDIAGEWVKRWRKTQPKPAKHLISEAWREAYGKPEPINNVPDFSFEQAAKIIETRWPGLSMGEPERTWARQPVIDELHKLRYEVRQSDKTREGSKATFSYAVGR